MPNKCARGCGKIVAFKRVYRKGHQPAGTSWDPEGKVKLANDKWNPINNTIYSPIYSPIYRAKLKRQRLEKDSQYIREHPDCENLQTEEELGNLIDFLQNSRCIVEFPSSTLSQLLEGEFMIAHTGLTFQMLSQEDLR